MEPDKRVKSSSAPAPSKTRRRSLPVAGAATGILLAALAGGYTIERGIDPGGTSQRPDLLEQSPLTEQRCPAVIEQSDRDRPGVRGNDVIAEGVNPTDPLGPPRFGGVAPPRQQAGQAARGPISGAARDNLCPTPLLETQTNDYPNYPGGFQDPGNPAGFAGNTSGGGLAGIAGGGASGAAGGGGSATSGGMKK